MNCLAWNCCTLLPVCSEKGKKNPEGSYTLNKSKLQSFLSYPWVSIITFMLYPQQNLSDFCELAPAKHYMLCW